MNLKFDKWVEFHEKNPIIYNELVALADKVIQVKEAYSVYALFHVIRFNRDIETTGEEFKISNDFIPFYARLLIIDHPKFKGFFRVKGGRYVDELRDSDFENYLEKSLNSLF